MNFYVYDIAFLVLFFLVAGIFLYINKKNLKFEKPLLIYRTKIGLKIIDYLSRRFRKQLKFLSYAVIGVGYMLMVAMIYLLIQIIYIYFKFPAIAKAVKIPPFMPLIPYITEIFNVQEIFPPFYFTYWIGAIAIIAVFHEFAHGIFARYNKIRVKSTGFGFLGPFLAAFVEPDEKQMRKKSKFAQLSILSAGSFANIILTVLFILIMWGFFAVAFTPAGASFDTYSYSLVNISSIVSVDNKTAGNYADILDISNDFNESKGYIEIAAYDENYVISKNAIIKQLNATKSKDISEIFLYHDAPAIRNNITGAIIEIDGIKIKNSRELGAALSGYFPGDNIRLKTEAEGKINEYNITLARNPGNESRVFLGISVVNSGRGFLRGVDIFSFIKDKSTYYKPKINGLSIFIYNFLWWLIIINLGVALFNMLPVGIFDGGQVFYLTILGITKSEKIAKKAFSIITRIILLMFILLIILWFFAFR